MKLQICQNIERERLSKGLSQQEVAEKMGLKRHTYKNWELSTEPPLSILKTIAGVLEIPAYKLLQGIIEFSDEPEKAGEVEFGFKLSEGDVEKIKFSLSVLDSVFSLDPGLKKDKSQRKQDLQLLGNKRTHSSKGVKSKQKGSD